jgi:hypothetical protein
MNSRIYYEVAVTTLTDAQKEEMAGDTDSLPRSKHVSPRVLAKFYPDPVTGKYGPEAQKLIDAGKALTHEEARAIKSKGKFKEANIGPSIGGAAPP